MRLVNSGATRPAPFLVRGSRRPRNLFGFFRITPRSVITASTSATTDTWPEPRRCGMIPLMDTNDHPKTRFKRVDTTPQVSSTTSTSATSGSPFAIRGCV